MMLEKIRAELAPYHATLVAVSKLRTVEQIMKLYQQGQRDFGENRVQELIHKQPLLPTDIRWHLIGHLQSNKVKYIAPFVHLIHSVDSAKLLKAMDKEAAKVGRIIDVLLQFKIAQEDTKYGFDWDTAEAMLQAADFQSFENIRICGVMGMATFTDDNRQVASEFENLHRIFMQMKGSFFAQDDFFRELSMGMSGDYLLALEKGSTMVRIGTKLFAGLGLERK